MKLMRISIYHASKMANYASKPKHPPTLDRWNYGTGQTPQNIKISVWNVNGIRSALQKGSLQFYLQTHQPDIFCVNQTKIDLEGYEKNINLFEKFSGYEQYWNFCKVSSGYSGVATFSKYKPIAGEEDFECGYLGLEGRCLTLQFDKFYLVNCYKPNSGADLSRLAERTELYDVNFQKYVNNLKERKNVIIAGDLNVAHNPIDLTNPKANQKNAGFTKQQRKQFDYLLRTGFIDSFRHFYPEKVQYTWWSTRALARAKNVGWRIDYILSSSQDILVDASIEDQVLGSDHCPVEAKFQFSQKPDFLRKFQKN